jgi:hypothetical protein
MYCTVCTVLKILCPNLLISCFATFRSVGGGGGDKKVEGQEGKSFVVCWVEDLAFLSSLAEVVLLWFQTEMYMYMKRAGGVSREGHTVAILTDFPNAADNKILGTNYN